MAFLDKKSIVYFFLLTVLLSIISSVSIETIQLPLTAADDGKLTTFIKIGSVEQQMQIDINLKQIQVCCKMEDTIWAKVYYFLSNPFFQIYDYTCKNPDQKGLVIDSAEISNLGLISINFIQQYFPTCSKGVLGLSNQSYFSTLLPVNLKPYTIFQNPSEYKKYTLKFGQDSTSVKEYAYFDKVRNFNWALQSDSTKFNQVLLGSYVIRLNSDSYFIQLPSKLYDFVAHELVTSFQCTEIDSRLYCPCETGLTASYPSFLFTLHNSFTLEIKPGNYLIQDSQICKVQLQESSQNYLNVNILFFQDFIFKFDPIHQRIGVLRSLNDQSTNQKIKLPLQLILNCLVILLLCIFLALVLIEIIKRVSGLGDVREEVFRVDVRDKNGYHYASD